jgi:hypothetical protein
MNAQHLPNYQPGVAGVGTDLAVHDGELDAT